MRILHTGAEAEKLLSQLTVKCTTLRWAVAWASHNFSLCKTLADNQGKIDQLAVGIHFYQTHPDFIAAFQDHPAVRFVMNPSGVFHPKLYYFEHGDGTWDCVIGSPNFTSAAFTANSEIAVHVSSNDADADTAHETLDRSLNEYFASGKLISVQELGAYRTIWNRQQPKLASLSGTYDSKAKKIKGKRSPLDVPLFTMSWPEYFDSVREDENHPTEGRLAVLEAAREHFQTHAHFNEIDDHFRRGIAGFVTSPDLDWLWFGSMKGAGFFKQAINQNSEQLSAALDCIPSEGELTQGHFDRFLDLFRDAFEKSGIATATRLLAFKRPDYFLCLDSKNRNNLCEAFEVPKNVDLDDYWEKVIGRITDSNWWNAPEPNDAFAKRVWRCRAAFLDVLFYVPD